MASVAVGTASVAVGTAGAETQLDNKIEMNNNKPAALACGNFGCLILAPIYTSNTYRDSAVSILLK
jgi:hypothetical protein